MPIHDRLRRRTLLHIRCLHRKLNVANTRFKASRRVGLIKSIYTELVQKRSHRDLRMGSNRIAQRQRAVRGQLGDEPVGQQPDDIVFFLLGAHLPADGDRSTRGRRWIPVLTIGVRRCCTRLGIGLGDRRDERGLVVTADIAARNLQRTLGIDADEGAGVDHLGRLEDIRPVLESFECLLELAEPRIYLVGQFVGIIIFLLKRIVFGVERVDACLLLGGQIRRRSLEPTQPVVMAVPIEWSE